MSNKYNDYFTIDKDFFRCIDEEALRKTPELWKKTYPHPTFVDLIKSTERMLAGSKSPVWIHGSYGTGKSQCAYTLKKILEVPEDELREYWSRFDILRQSPNTDLLEKLIGHKKRNIVVAYRYASGGINGIKDLLRAVQDSIRQALINSRCKELGENTLRDSVISWIDDPTRKRFFDDLLQKPEYASRFAQSTADEVLEEIRKGGELKQLFDNIFYLAGKEGITALNYETDRLIEWIKEVVKLNDIRLVLIWDEFSAYFTNNRGSLDEFQKIASLAQSTAFYFMIVTHQTRAVFPNPNDQFWRVVQQRYDIKEISLPDSIAFQLIGSALDAVPEWNTQADMLYLNVTESTKAVIEQIKKNEPDSKITPDDFKKIMPFHPYAAMILKYISTAFGANHRSMFDFIKTADNEDVKAFQWFIANSAGDDDRPFLTVDLLWDFFYEKGRDQLTPDIQAILDTYPRQSNLNDKERTVLKAILIIQAIDHSRRSQIELFHITDNHLSLVFEGVTELDGNAAITIAKQLVENNILFKRKIDNKEVYAVVPIVSDRAKLEEKKTELRNSLTTKKLVEDGVLGSTIELPDALKIRFDIDTPNGKIYTATNAEFTKFLNSLNNRDFGWRFAAVLCLAKDDSEVSAFRKAIEAAARENENKHIIFIDALSTPLGEDALMQYIDFQAESMLYIGNDGDFAKEYAKKAKEILNKWQERIEKGNFIVYSTLNRTGERFTNINGVLGALQSHVTTQYPYLLDFNKGVTNTMLKLSHGKASAKHGAEQTSGGVVVNAEKFTLDSIWKVDRYWEQPRLSSHKISIIKIALERKINDAFDGDSRQISIRELYDTLEIEYGFSESNLSAFITGFLLKEYCVQEYRFIDSTGKPRGEDKSRADTLAEMISEYIDKKSRDKYKDTYIARMTPAERAFYQLSERAFGIVPNSCATVGVAAISIGNSIAKLGLPIWTLDTVDNDLYYLIEKYISLVQTSDGSNAQKIAIEIGEKAQENPMLGDSLNKLITKENCQKGMREFLKTFEDGKILELSNEINAEINLIDDIRRLFSVERHHLWDRETGEDEIRKLLTEYGIVKETNGFLMTLKVSLKDALSAWRNKLKFLRISAEAIKIKEPELVKLMDFLLKIYNQIDLLPEQLKSFHAELQTNGEKLSKILVDERTYFADVYKMYIDELNEDDCSELISKLTNGMFAMSTSDCNIRVKEEAERLRKGQLKTKLLEKWKAKTNTANPREWSSKHMMPILAMVADDDYTLAKRVFETINNNNPTESAIKEALDYIESTTIFEDLQSQEKRDVAFVKHVIEVGNSKMVTIEQVKEKLYRLIIEPYEWLSNPTVKSTIKKLVDAEYYAGGSDRALSIFAQIPTHEKETYIERLIRDNVAVGIEIIMRGGSIGG